MDYLFEAKNFALTKTSIQLLRRKFPYKKIDFSNVVKIQLKEGTEVKLPFVSLVFGFVLISISIYLMIKFYKLPEGSFDSKASGQIVLSLLFIESFLIGLGGYSIFRALPIHDVVTFTLNNGRKESFDISGTIHDNKIDLLLKYLSELAEPGKLVVDSKYKS